MASKFGTRKQPIATDRYWPVADLIAHILAHPLNDCKWHVAASLVSNTKLPLAKAPIIWASALRKNNKRVLCATSCRSKRKKPSTANGG